VKTASFPSLDALQETNGPRVIAEAAPGRLRIRALAIAILVLFTGLTGRAVQLAVMGDPKAHAKHNGATAPLIVRADLTDRNGVLLATTIPSFAIIADPKKVWDAADVARKLAKRFPELDVATVQRKLEQRERAQVQIKRDLTPRQKQEVLDLGLPGISFEEQSRRVYPQGQFASHLLGGVNAQRAGVAGVELGLDDAIRRSGLAGDALRLSIDVRIQHALEAELLAAIDDAQAQGGAGIVLDGRTGETLAIASAPSFDPNAAPAGDDPRRLNRAVGAVYEMGSTMKPFTVAMALDAGLTTPDEKFDLTKPISLQGYEIKEFHPIGAALPLHTALAQSSNIMAATLALRVGTQKQRATLAKLGLYERSPLELSDSAKPLPPQNKDQLSTAVLGYGHGMAFSLAALAGAYTVFTNEGARVQPTLLARARGDEVRKIPVFAKQSTRDVIVMMREAVRTGTAQRANVKGLEIAGKTGSAEKPRKEGGGYAPDVMLSSFAAVFTANDPHYVIVIALDEPGRTAAFDNLATGGAVAAPAVGRVAARIAPLLGANGTNVGESP
jgi:cell division protein FtsI (penicillin-binding protein 3)